MAEVKASEGERLRDLIDYAKAGALFADWAIVKTKGHMNALALIATGPLSTDSMRSGIEAELKHCDDCKTKVMNFPVPDWGTRITPGVQAALLADPTINYSIVIYDSMSPFVVPAVTITGSQKKVGVDAFNGTPFVLGLVQQGQVEMDIGENLDRIGHAIIDAEMRRVCGLPLVANPKIPYAPPLCLHPGKREGCRNAAPAVSGLRGRLCRCTGFLARTVRASSRLSRFWRAFTDRTRGAALRSPAQMSRCRSRQVPFESTG